MKRIFYVFFVLLFVTAISGCQVHSFLPQTHNVPLFTDKNQFKVSPTLTYRAFDVNIAYSSIKHFGIITNLQYGGNYIVPEIGAGIYHAFNNKFIFELYGGYGYSFIDFTDTVTRFSLLQNRLQPFKYYNTHIAANKYFIQPNIGLYFNENLELAMSLKITYWQYLNYYYNYERWQVDYNSGNRYLYLAHEDKMDIDAGDQITIEPSVTFKVGSKIAKFMIQGGWYFAENINKEKIDPYGDEIPYFIKMGVCVGFDYNNKKKKEIKN